ncbi:MAG: hypothetical protein M1569_02565 [Candidatus Marsarchaeota archaeon]|nr:hypothetical protein [Candidatus Marsarchaeota archaeon]
MKNQKPNIVLNSTTQLATVDFAVVEANISKRVNSGASHPPTTKARGLSIS